MNVNNNVLLPYQAKWASDTSTVKVWEKSRRIGASFSDRFYLLRPVAR